MVDWMKIIVFVFSLDFQSSQKNVNNVYAKLLACSGDKKRENKVYYGSRDLHVYWCNSPPTEAMFHVRSQDCSKKAETAGSCWLSIFVVGINRVLSFLPLSP